MTDLRSPPDECDECGVDDIFLNTYCNDCDQWMCASCDAEIHRRGRRARHTRRYRKEGEDPSFGDVRGATIAGPSGGRDEEGGDSASDPYSTLASPEAPPKARLGGLLNNFGAGRRSLADRPVPPPPADGDDDDDENWVPPSLLMKKALSEKEHEEALNSSSVSSSTSSMIGTSSPSAPTPVKTSSSEKLKTSSPTLKYTGLLKKKKKKGIRVFQERFCKLYSHELQYYRKQSDSQPAGAIAISSIKSVAIIADSKGLKFDVVMGEKSSDRTFSFAAPSKDECQAWVKHINDCLSEASSSASVTYLPPSEGSVSNLGHSDSSPTSSLIGAPHDKDGDSDTEDTERECELTLKISNEWKSYKIPFAEIYNAHDREEKDYQVVIFAVKKKEDLFKETEKAIQEFAKIENPFFLHMLHHGYSSDRIFGVFQPPGDTLALHLDRHSRFPETVIRIFAAQLVQALGSLHERKHVFQNLHPQRLFLDPEDGHIIIGDFLVFFPPEKIPIESEFLEYTPPEAPKSTGVSDWWRLGILLYEMVVGVPPIRSTSGTSAKQDLPDKIKNFNSQELRFPPGVSSELQSFIKRLLVTDPSQRLGAKGVGEVKAHEWLAEAHFNWQALISRTLSMGWISDHIIDHKLAGASAHSKSGGSQFRYSVQVELGEGRNLPYACEKGVYFQISIEDQVQTTPVFTLKEGETVWNWKGTNYNFSGVDPESKSDIVIEVMLESKGKFSSETLVGLMTFPLVELKAIADQSTSGEVDLWSSVLEPSGLPTFSEIHLNFKIQIEKTDTTQKSIVSLKIPFRQTFFDYFGKPGAADDRSWKPTSTTNSSPPPPAAATSPSAAKHKPDLSRMQRQSYSRLDDELGSSQKPPAPPPRVSGSVSVAPAGSSNGLGIGSRPSSQSVAVTSESTDTARKSGPVLGAVKLPTVGVGGAATGLKKVGFAKLP